jgi:hypothetical protein
MPARDKSRKTMKTSEYQTIIERLFREWEAWPGELASFRVIPVFDHANGHYLLLTMGWEPKYRIHSILVQVDIIGDKLWIQADHTETGFASELLAAQGLNLGQAGVPKDKIVLGFKRPERRQFTEFAVA